MSEKGKPLMDVFSGEKKETHVRRSFYLTREVVDALKTEGDRLRRSPNWVLQELLRVWAEKRKAGA